MKPRTNLILLLFVLTGLGIHCIVEDVCYNSAECTGDKDCINGQCAYECVHNDDCSGDLICEDHHCIPAGELVCDADMARIENLFCMDVYEASKSDATSLSEGTDTSQAYSQEGVIPWRTDFADVAKQACEAAGKRLCTPEEWEFSCTQNHQTIYAYGDNYITDICNGIDAFGMGSFHLAPTGSFPECINQYGVYDLNGNLWEHNSSLDPKQVRGGAYNCSDSQRLHKCSYVPFTWRPSALGFRCCSDGERLPE